MSTGRYAKGTTVPVMKTRVELDELLSRLGERLIRLVINRDPKAKRHDQADREAWRRLLLVVKAKLEIVASGSSTPEREFLADVLLPNGQTVHEHLRRDIAQSYKDGKMPPLLGPGGS